MSENPYRRDYTLAQVEIDIANLRSRLAAFEDLMEPTYNKVIIRTQVQVDGEQVFSDDVSAHNIYPAASETYDLGSNALQWKKIYATDIQLDGTLVITGDITGHLIPDAADTYDLGSSTKLWRKGYLSELEAVLFAQQTVTLIGGWLYICKNEGTIASSIDDGDTEIDFQTSMTPGDFVLFRSALKVEYIEISSLDSGTTYNVTRDKDGSGANDWPSGTPFAVLGASGDGRIELNAYDTPRIQIIEQGATYNAQTEKARFGDLNGNWGYSSAIYGLALGEYAANKPNITLDSTNGLRIRNYTANVMTFDTSGNAKITGKLQLLDSNSALAIGSEPPTASNAGTGIWLDRTGLFSLDDGTYQVKIDAADGKLYAGGGNVIIDEDGIGILSEDRFISNNTYRLLTLGGSYCGGLYLTYDDTTASPTILNYLNLRTEDLNALTRIFIGAYSSSGAGSNSSAVVLVADEDGTQGILTVEPTGVNISKDLDVDNDLNVDGDFVVDGDITYKSVVLGEWDTYTATVSYGGGTTDPDSETKNTAYCRVGDVIHFAIYIDITQGSGDRTTTSVSLPVTAANTYFGSGFRHSLNGATPQVGPAYFSSTSTIAFYHGAMTKDGVIIISGSYRAA